MLSVRFTLTAMTGVALAISAPAIAQEQAQTATPLTDSEIADLPPELQTAPVLNETTETITGEDGVETIVRTRYISRSRELPANGQTYGYPQGYAPAYGYGPQPVVFEREQWLEECRRRTADADDDDKGGIIGGLLGAIAGGIIGNRLDDGERLAGTLIGAGTGGLAGYAIGSLIGGSGDDEADYDCEAVLDSYLDRYGNPTTRLASRSIPAYGYGYPAAYAPPAYGYAGGYGYPGCACAQPTQVVMVPVEYQTRQRVIVREDVSEETYTVPGRVREIPEPQPVPQPTKVVPVPRPVKSIKN